MARAKRNRNFFDQNNEHIQPVKRSVGRPRATYDPEVAELVLEEMAKGEESLKSICQRHQFPDRSIIYRWVLENREFASRFFIAREIQMHGYADDIIRMADEGKDTGRSRMQIAARQWTTSRLLPRVYGDNINHEHTISPTSSVSPGVYEAMTPEEREQMRAILMAAMRRQQAEEGVVLEQPRKAS